MSGSRAPEQTMANEAPRSVDVLLKEVLGRLQAAAPKKHKELRDECTAGLEKLEGATGITSADEYFRALKYGCEAAGSPKVVAIALDAIAKLMASNYLSGTGPDPFKEDMVGGQPRTLMDSIIDAICGSAEQQDDTVQQLIVRALSTALTSQTLEVHGASLMKAVSACFAIHRDSKNPTNQRTAHAALTQILTVVTQKMEQSSSDRRSQTTDGDRVNAKAPPSSDLALQPPAKVLEEWMSSYVNRLVDQVTLQKDPAQGGGTAEMLGRPGKFGWCIVCRAPAAHYCVDTRDPVCGHPCKFKNLERLNLVETHYGGRRDDEEQPGPPVAVVEVECEKEPTEATIPLASAPRMESVMGDEQAAVEMGVEHGEKALSMHHLDALMVFSSLCKQSMKDLPPGQTDSRIVKSKRLSLELILGMLQNCGPVFRSSEPFIAVLKKSLCVSLIKNSVSSIPKVFHLSLQIFVLLIPNFKDHLKTEIGVFIEQIFLRILESGNSTFQHKLRVLQVFYKLCTDASTALELFINFDCDVDEKNIFERLIDCLSKIAQGKYTSSEHANLIRPEQELELKMLALQAVVTLMGSIVDWARRMSEDKRELPTKTEVSKADGESDGEEDAQSDATHSTSAGASTAPTASTLSAIVEQKQRKHELQIGVNKFNMKPKRGIEYLKQNGFFGDDPLAIADFFRNPDLGLDKGQVGDFLGEDKPFNKSILYALVDGQDFAALELDFALRAFLSTFRLPGEAQKIDRMMEKFAEKFCQDNPGTFTTADCAYVLSFSLIMLQTDLHNPGIKKKMSKEDFVWNNRGINDGSDLPKEYLEKLYESVKENPFSLDEDQEARNRMESQAAQGATQKFELFVRETESIVQKSQELMKQKVLKNKDSKFVAAQNVEHVRPLFEVACWPMLATLAVLLEMQDAAQSVELCIEGFKHCIRIAARFDMDTERDAFVSSLAKFTYLTTLKEMKQKNIECIKALMSIALSEGNNLGPSWQYVLHCISQLDRMQLINIRARQDFQFFQEEEAKGVPRPDAQSAVVKRRAYGTGVSALMAMGADDKQLELVNSESVMAQIDAAQIDLLFNRSASLASGAIVHFVTQLARVSKEELAVPEQPRIFSLQKLVEVADFNMGRIRIVWSKIWRVLALHFIEAASHQNIKVCMYAIDSLRQLSMKFLEKDELSNYNFQVEFLRPFETVMLNSGGTVSKEVKEYIVSIISNMVQSRITNIKSGWKIVFHILRAAAQEHNTKAVPRSAFIVMDTVVQHHFEIFVENFSEGVRALLAFGQCKAELELSMRAITYLLQAAEYLADSSKPDPPPPSTKDNKDLPTPAVESSGSAANGSHPAAHWFPILRGLSTLVGDPRREIRAAALDGVFECLREYGSAVFDEDTWRMAFNGVIKPLFDDIHHQLADQRKSEGTTSDGKDAAWALSMVPPTCLAALTALVRLFDAQIEALGFLLDEVLKLLENCIQHDTEAVARIGVEGFKQLLLLAGKKLKPHQWEKVTQCILELFKDSMPTQLLCTDTQSSGDQLPFRRDDVVIKCVVQLLLIDMLQDTVSQHYSQIPPAGVMTLVDALKQSFEFAQEFNKQIELRQVLKKRGFMPEMRQLPGLLKQEREALSCSLKILFQVQTDPKIRGSTYASTAVERLMRLCSSVLSNYVAKERLLQEQSDAQSAEGEKKALVVEIEREVLGLVPIVSEVVLRGLKDLEQEQFAKYLPGMFPLLAELVAVNSREVRVVVRDILVEQVAPHFPEAPATT
mmetsp:Transcript_58738/g.137076  ORF Transcript_58738/g.137076 Transcript_58738/m.137076 type:complete len:1749 (+) Transcript_58738:59-5305(+)